MRKIKVLHLEPTDVCQLACPLCARETDKEFKKSFKNHLTIPQIQQHLTNQEIKELDKMFMCGNYGDPVASKHTLDVYRWFRQINPDITLGMNTNGGLKTHSWWQALGQMLNRQRDYVVFSIDGLEDTNHIYRRNVDWQRLMSNVKSFIAAGGRAHWDMLIFRHNEHQVEQARQLAADMGFAEFRCKVSRRFGSIPVEYLQPPVKYQPDFHSTDDITEISCSAYNERSVYMDYKGNILPCCWIGSSVNKATPAWPWPFQPAVNVPICKRTCGIQGASNYQKQWINADA